MSILLLVLVVWVFVIPALIAFGSTAVVALVRRRSGRYERGELAEVIPFDPVARGARLVGEDFERLSGHPTAPVA